MTWEVVQKMLENAWFMSCSPFPGCQVVGWILILVSIPNCSLSYSDYDTVDGSEILVQKSCTTWHVHETLQKMGHLPYQLAQDFWTINSSWEFCHSTTRISFRYSFRCGSIWVNRPASFKVADLFSIHFWKHAATDVTNGIFVPNLQFFLKHVSFSFTFQTPAIRAMSSSKPQRYSVWIGKRNAPMESVEAINTMLKEQGFHYECHTRNWEQGDQPGRTSLINQTFTGWDFGWLFLCPIGSMYGTHIYLHLPWKSTKCR